MSDFVEQCRKEWRRLGVADPLAEEMAADLASDLEDAEAKGVSVEELLGKSVSDPRSFAASWVSERGIIPVPSGRGNARRRPLALVAFTALAAITVIVAARDRGAEAVTRHDQNDPGRPEPISRPQRKRSRPRRVDPAAACHRRARLRCMAVGELGPLATTRRPHLAITLMRPLPGVIAEHRRSPLPLRSKRLGRKLSTSRLRDQFLRKGRVHSRERRHAP